MEKRACDKSHPKKNNIAMAMATELRNGCQDFEYS
jgi:hypothetical protein